MSQQRRITDDLDAMLGVLPATIVEPVHAANNYDRLLEIILDLGRVPTARFVDNEITLRESEVTREELDHVIERIGEFDADNRAGIERTLHRISAIRNRRSHIVGLTLRVGRAVYGTIDIIQDIIESGKSALILGRPGVGKTTLLREAARILAESRRVVRGIQRDRRRRRCASSAVGPAHAVPACCAKVMVRRSESATPK
jgi:stage III sporulation protein SpoIIIAA